MNETAPIPSFPALARRLMAPLPPAPLAPALRRLLVQSMADHPEVFARLGEHATKSFEIDPTDLPFVIVMRPDAARPELRLCRRGKAEADCKIAGPLAALLGMVHGAYDGDALFFSRDIVMEGDTAAGLALRNAIDNAELDLFDEIIAALPRFARRLSPSLAKVVEIAERRSGVALRRVDFADGGWA